MKSIEELDKITIKNHEGKHTPGHWYDDYLLRASALERVYVKKLSPKALLAYRQHRENEVFLDQI